MRWPWQDLSTPPPSVPAVTSRKALTVRREHANGVPDAVPTELAIPPRKLDSTHYLRDEEREFLLQQLAQFRTYKEINAALIEHYNVTITPHTVDYYCTHPKWEKLIRIARLSHLTRTMSVPIANKLVRMERLERLYQYAVHRGKTEEALSHLRAAREEIEPLEKKTDVRDIYINQQIAYFDRAQCERRLAEMETKQEGLNAISQASAALPNAQETNGR